MLKYFCAVIILIISILSVFFIKESEEIPQNLSVSQIEITSPGPLLSSDCSLIEVGWARYPIKEFNLETINLPFFTRLYVDFRTKKWDFYSIINEQFLVLVAIADVGYLGNSFIHIIDLKNNKKYFSDLDILPHNRPKFYPDSCNHTLKEEFKYETSNYLVSYVDDINNSDSKNNILKKTITFHSNNEDKISGKFIFEKEKTHEDIVMIIPLSNDKKNFYYNVKSYTVPVSGELTINGEKTNFVKEKSNLGMDFGRGIWNYNTVWIWGHANGFLNDGRRIGFNLGGGFQNYDEGRASEDSLFINGKIYKLNVAKYFYDENENDLSKNWTFKTEQDNIVGSCNIFFQRTTFNIKKINAFFLKSQIKQFFGFYSGWAIIDNNTKITFENIPGLAEAHRARW